MNLVWYRNDLRVHAHRALQQALAQGGPVIAVYCLCEQQWDAHEVAPLRRWYVLQSLLELGDALAARGWICMCWMPVTSLPCRQFWRILPASMTLSTFSAAASIR